MICQRTSTHISPVWYDLKSQGADYVLEGRHNADKGWMSDLRIKGNASDYDFGPEDLKSLSDDVDGYSLMTYDFSNPQKPGPNAPLVWVRSCMQLLLGAQTDHSRNLSQKIFLGINFYGNDFVLQGGMGGGAILGRDYLSLLEKHKPQLQWEKKSGEHYFLYLDENKQHVVFYPSLLSIAMRLDEARSWGAGISIWEIGQGLDYFFDLL